MTAANAAMSTIVKMTVTARLRAIFRIVETGCIYPLLVLSVLCYFSTWIVVRLPACFASCLFVRLLLVKSRLQYMTWLLDIGS